MLAAKKYIALFLFGCCLLQSVHGDAPVADFKCTEPPEGTWNVEHYVQIAPVNYSHRFHSVLTMHKEFGNAFVGTTNTTDLLQGGHATFLFGAIFDLDSCILSGSFAQHEFQGVDQFRAVYNGNTMVGDYIVLIAGELAFPQFSRFVFTYQG